MRSSSIRSNWSVANTLRNMILNWKLSRWKHRMLWISTKIGVRSSLSQLQWMMPDSSQLNQGCMIEADNFIGGGEALTEFDCELACSKEGGYCKYYTWYPGSDGFSQFCFLFTECLNMQDCPGCYKGSVDCNVPK